MKYLSILLSLLFITSCGVQSLPQGKNAVEAALAETMNQYKRRADLIPNLVKTVKGYAKHESETLTLVIEARSKATQTKVDLKNVTPEQLQNVQNNQGQLSQALGKLMMISERYPDLKADKNFRDLQVKIEGSENRIAVARQRYIKAIENFNNLITVPPASFTNKIFYNFTVMPQWAVTEDEKGIIEKAPEINF